MNKQGCDHFSLCAFDTQNMGNTCWGVRRMQPARPVGEAVYGVGLMWAMAAGKEATVIAIEDVTWTLDEMWWDGPDGEDLAPRSVLRTPWQWKEHATRIVNADTSYALVVRRLADGRTDVLDGLHRLCQLVQRGMESVRVVYLSEGELRQCIIEPTGPMMYEHMTTRLLE